MEELSFKDLTTSELNSLKDLYIENRLESMSENDLRNFVREIIKDQIKGTVGNSEEKEAWEEMKEHFSEDFVKKITEIKSKTSKAIDITKRTPDEMEFDRRLSLLKQQQEEKSSKDMWNDE